MPNATTTLIYEDRRPLELAAGAGRGLWVNAGELTGLTGWELRPEGLCRAGLCLPVSPERDDLLGDSGESISIAAVARLAGQPLVCDDEHAVCAVGQSASVRAESLAGGLAPDFALPDLEGTEHRLSELRGRKVLLVTWASW